MRGSPAVRNQIEADEQAVCLRPGGDAGLVRAEKRHRFPAEAALTVFGAQGGRASQRRARDADRGGPSSEKTPSADT